MKPILCVDELGNPIAKIENDDVVFCFNFRTDRGREITEVLSQKAFPDFGMTPLKLHYITLTNYDKDFKEVKVVFDEEVLSDTLGEVLERNGKSQIRVAETEKYPHVTFFFQAVERKNLMLKKESYVQALKMWLPTTLNQKCLLMILPTKLYLN